MGLLARSRLASPAPVPHRLGQAFPGGAQPPGKQHRRAPPRSNPPVRAMARAARIGDAAPSRERGYRFVTTGGLPLELMFGTVIATVTGPVCIPPAIPVAVTVSAPVAAPPSPAPLSA